MKNQFLKLVVTFIIMTLSVTLANAQWESKAAGFPAPPQLGINEMIAVNKKDAWAVAYERNNAFVNPLTNFTRTTDGGKHWIAGTISSEPDQFIVGIAPVSAKKAYVLCAGSDFVGKVLKTTDGGISWDQLNVAPFPMFYENIYFFNANDGVVLGDTNMNSDIGAHAIFLTHNGGKKWQQVPAANLPIPDPTEAYYPFSMEAVGNTIWTVSTTAHIWKSVDKGLHWASYPTDRPNAVTSNLKMSDAMNGLWGIEGDLYRTSDGGVTWTELSPTGTFFTFDLAYVPGTESTYISTGGDTSNVDFFTGGLHGLGSSYSVDGGNTWVTIDTAVDHLAIDMVSPSKGYCGGFNTGMQDGVFIYDGSDFDNTSKKNYSEMCHQGQTIWVANNEIEEHKAQGDYLGLCSQSNPAELKSANINDALISNEILSGFNINPNPVANSSLISFSLTQSTKVSLQIFDLNGKLVATLADREFTDGANQLEFNAEKLNNGIYLLKIQSADFSKTEKLIVAK